MSHDRQLPAIRVCLFGPPQLILNGTPVQTKKGTVSSSYFCHLAFHGKPVTHYVSLDDKVVNSGGDVGAGLEALKKQRAALRTLLATLVGQQGVGKHYVVCQGGKTWLDHVTSDWGEFKQKVRAAREADPRARRARYAEVAEHYSENLQGEFLAGAVQGRAGEPWPWKKQAKKEVLDYVTQVREEARRYGVLIQALQDHFDDPNEARTAFEALNQSERRLLAILMRVGGVVSLQILEAVLGATLNPARVVPLFATSSEVGGLTLLRLRDATRARFAGDLATLFEEQGDMPTLAVAFERLSTALEPLLRLIKNTHAYDQLEAQKEALRCVVDWLTEHDLNRGAAMVSTLQMYFVVRATQPGLQFCTRILERASELDDLVRADLLRCAGALCLTVGDSRAHGFLAEGLSALASRGEHLREARLHMNVALAHLYSGEATEATVEFSRVETLLARSPEGEAKTVEKSTLHLNRALIPLEAKQYEDAIRDLTEALTLKKELGDIEGQGLCHHNLGEAYCGLSRSEDALKHYRAALQAFLEIDDDRLVVHAMEAVARLEGDDLLALRLLSAARACRWVHGFEMADSDRKAIESRVEEIRLGNDSIAVEFAIAQGLATPLREAAQDALKPAAQSESL